MLFIGSGDAVWGELPEEAFGDGGVGYEDLLDLEDDLPVEELGKGDLGAVEVAELIAHGLATHGVGNLDVEATVLDFLDPEGFSQGLEGFIGRDGEVDFLGAQREGDFLCSFGGGRFEVVEFGFEGVEGLGVVQERGHGSRDRFIGGEFGNLGIEFEEVPNDEAHEEEHGKDGREDHGTSGKGR